MLIRGSLRTNSNSFDSLANLLLELEVLKRGTVRNNEASNIVEANKVVEVLNLG